MRKTLVWLTYAGLATALLAATGAATANHDQSCGTADQTIPVPRAEVSVWTSNCTGAVVHFNNFACDGGIHQEVADVHVLLLADTFGCRTGVVVE